jgi:hypothetical protein
MTEKWTAPDLAAVTADAFYDELSKLAAAGSLGQFWQGAKHEIGPALGAVTGAGLAKATGFDPLAGAAAGYGLGATPDIIHALKERRLAKTLAKTPNIGSGI